MIFFFNDTATTEIYTLSLHDALPISDGGSDPAVRVARLPGRPAVPPEPRPGGPLPGAEPGRKIPPSRPPRFGLIDRLKFRPNITLGRSYCACSGPLISIEFEVMFAPVRTRLGPAAVTT